MNTLSRNNHRSLSANGEKLPCPTNLHGEAEKPCRSAAHREPPFSSLERRPAPPPPPPISASACRCPTSRSSAGKAHVLGLDPACVSAA